MAVEAACPKTLIPAIDFDYKRNSLKCDVFNVECEGDETRDK